VSLPFHVLSAENGSRPCSNFCDTRENPVKLRRILKWLCLSVLAAAFGCGSGERGVVLARDEAGAEASAGSGSLPVDQTGGSGGAGGEGHEAQTLAERCTPEVTVDNQDSAGNGRLFDENVADPVALVQRVAQATCAILYRGVNEVPEAPPLTVVIADFDGVMATSEGTIELSSRHLATIDAEGSDVAHELEGLFYFALTNVYQNDGASIAPSWLITGVADYVRYDAGFTDVATRAAGGTWEDGYRTTAFFLDYLTSAHPDIVYELNQRLAPGAAEPFSTAAFSELTGKELATLWDEYQASL
jgi:hypothetical protein